MSTLTCFFLALLTTENDFTLHPQRCVAPLVWIVRQELLESNAVEQRKWISQSSDGIDRCFMGQCMAGTCLRRPPFTFHVLRIGGVGKLQHLSAKYSQGCYNRCIWKDVSGASMYRHHLDLTIFTLLCTSRSSPQLSGQMPLFLLGHLYSSSLLRLPVCSGDLLDSWCSRWSLVRTFRGLCSHMQLPGIKSVL